MNFNYCYKITYESGETYDRRRNELPVVNITVRQSRQSGVARFFRNCPSFASNGFISVIKYWYQLKAVNDNE